MVQADNPLHYTISKEVNTINISHEEKTTFNANDGDTLTFLKSGKTSLSTENNDRLYSKP